MFKRIDSSSVRRTGLWMLLLSAGSLAACVAEMGEEEETVGEVREALTTEVCNGIDDDGDFLVDEGNVCALQTQVYAGHEYMLADLSLDRDNARAACLGQSFDLAKIESSSENAWLAGFVSVTQNRWIGLDDRTVEGAWRWTDGSVPTYTNWSPGEPNNYNDEDCGVLSDTSKWNDLNCSWMNKAVCELMNPVSWQNINGPISVYGTRLTRTQYAWNVNAGASSSQTISSGNGFVEFTSFETNKAKLAGFGYGSDTPGPGDILFGILLDNGGGISIAEQGGHIKAALGTYNAGDVFRVEVLDGVVRYLRNGAVFYISNTMLAYPLRLDVSLSDQGATIGNARLRTCAPGDEECMNPGRWGLNVKNVLARKDALKRVGGVGFTWDAGASSRETIDLSNEWVRFSTAEVNTDKALGLSEVPGNYSSGDFGLNMDFSFVLASDNHAYVYEDGVQMYDCGPYAVNEKLWINVSNSEVIYYLGSNSCYTSTKKAGNPLYIDAAFKTLGATITDLFVSSLDNHPTEGCNTPDTCDQPKP